MRQIVCLRYGLSIFLRVVIGFVVCANLVHAQSTSALRVSDVGKDSPATIRMLVGPDQAGGSKEQLREIANKLRTKLESQGARIATVAMFDSRTGILLTTFSASELSQ